MPLYLIETDDRAEVVHYQLGSYPCPTGAYKRWHAARLDDSLWQAAAEESGSKFTEGHTVAMNGEIKIREDTITSLAAALHVAQKACVEALSARDEVRRHNDVLQVARDAATKELAEAKARIQKFDYENAEREKALDAALKSRDGAHLETSRLRAEVSRLSSELLTAKGVLKFFDPDSVFAEIIATREKQRAEWGHGIDHGGVDPDNLNANAWCPRIVSQVSGTTERNFREGMVWTAAMAVAAVESVDASHKRNPPAFKSGDWVRARAPSPVVGTSAIDGRPHRILAVKPPGRLQFDLSRDEWWAAESFEKCDPPAGTKS